MEFGVEKCAVVLVMRKRKRERKGSVCYPTKKLSERSTESKAVSNFGYFGGRYNPARRDNGEKKAMDEYFRRIRKLLETKDILKEWEIYRFGHYYIKET